MHCYQTWDKHLAQMLEALLQALEKCLSTSTNALIKKILQVKIITIKMPDIII